MGIDQSTPPPRSPEPASSPDNASSDSSAPHPDAAWPDPEGCAPRIASYDEFFDFYLMEHLSARSRRLHYLGTVTASLLVLAFLATGKPLLLLMALIFGYGPAWIGHFMFERNRPATFRYPLWSLISDYRMLYLWLTGRIEEAMAGAAARRLGDPGDVL